MIFSLDFRREIAALAERTGGPVLDLGCRDGSLAAALEREGHEVYTADLLPLDRDGHHRINVVEDPLPGPCGVVVASHVLEHVLDKGRFLANARAALRPDGWFVCIVPPWKEQVVGGHVNAFNMGLLIYHLILAGFDCTAGSFTRRGYSLAAFVQPSTRPLPALAYDAGDIERLDGFWPFPARQGFDGRMEAVNWPPAWAA